MNDYDDDVGGDALSDGENEMRRLYNFVTGGDEEEEMFSVIEPVRGMSTVKFISYNIIFYVRV